MLPYQAPATRFDTAGGDPSGPHSTVANPPGAEAVAAMAETRVGRTRAKEVASVGRTGAALVGSTGGVPLDAVGDSHEGVRAAAVPRAEGGQRREGVEGDREAGVLGREVAGEGGQGQSLLGGSGEGQEGAVGEDGRAEVGPCRELAAVTPAPGSRGGLPAARAPD